MNGSITTTADTKQAVLEAWLAACERNGIDGFAQDVTHDGRDYTVAVDGHRGHNLQITFWTDDESGEDVEACTVLLHAAVAS